MSKIAVIDLSFTWPPDGGARTDVREVCVRLAEKHEVKLFVPEILGWMKIGKHWIQKPLDRTRFFWKGKISSDVGLDYEKIPFGPLSFSAWKVGKAFREAVTSWGADRVFVADGWYLKPYVISELKDFRPVVRFYAHEMLCLKGNGFFFKWGKPCFRNYLNQKTSTSLRCLACTSSFYLKYPSPTWIHEFLSSMAWWPGYVHKVIQSLRDCQTAIVYNEFTANRVRPFAEDVRIVPSGVDLKNFQPEAEENPRSKKIILGMGRMEEPRKGGDVLVNALKLLRHERKDFELWLTAKKNYGETWIKPLGWTKYEDMPKLYSSVDVAVVPSMWPEPHGIVAVEALACGVPVLGSEIGGLAEICRNIPGARSFPPGNVGALKEMLNQYLDDPQPKMELKEKGIEKVSTLYEWDRIVSEEIEPCFS